MSDSESFTDHLHSAIGFAICAGPGLVRAIQYIIYQLLHDLLGFLNSFGGTITTPPLRCQTTKATQVPQVENHQYVKPKQTDYRSPCPALNTLANHGYIPRNGRSISASQFAHGLMDAYNLSGPLAYFLSYGTLFGLGQAGSFSLSDLARHNFVEHDASITHANTADGDEYAPICNDPKLVEAFFLDIESSPKRQFGMDEVAKVRVRREADPGNTVTVQQQDVARGEVAVVLGVFGGREKQVPVDVLRSFWLDERLPEGWTRPSYSTGLIEIVKTVLQIRTKMRLLRKNTSITTTAELLADRQEEVVNVNEKYENESIEDDQASDSSQTPSLTSTELLTPTDDVSFVSHTRKRSTSSINGSISGSIIEVSA